MYSKLLTNARHEKIYPMIENAIYVNRDNYREVFTVKNALYIIDDNIKSDARIEIPVNCVLKFNHNCKFEDSNITLLNTYIEAYDEAIFITCNLTGFILNAEIPVEWFGAVGDGVTDDSLAINDCIKNTTTQTIIMGRKNYFVKSTILFTQDNAPSYDRLDVLATKPINKSLICYGTIIGGLKEPIISINMPNNKIYIDTIKVCSSYLPNCAIHCQNFGHDCYIGTIQKVNNEGTDKDLFIPSITPSSVFGGTAITFDGTCKNGKIKIGEILGFEKGLEFINGKKPYTSASTNFWSSFTITGCEFTVNEFTNVDTPIFINNINNNNNHSSLLRYNKFNIGQLNTSQLLMIDPAENSLIKINKASEAFDIVKDLQFYILNATGKCKNVINLDNVNNIKFEGNFDLTGLGYDNLKWKSYIDSSLFLYNINNCENITISDEYNPKPLELFNVKYSKNVKVVSATLGHMLNQIGEVDSSICAIFDEALFTPYDEVVIQPEIHGLPVPDKTLCFITPNVKFLNNIEYVSELPVLEDRDITKWYAVPVDNKGIAKYKVYIYDTLFWVGDVDIIDGHKIDLYFAKHFDNYDAGEPIELEF